MNNKKAKALRKRAEMMTRGLPWVTHTKVNEHPKIYGFDLLTRQPQIATVSTVMLDACGKATYKELKSLYKNKNKQLTTGNLRV